MAGAVHARKRDEPDAGMEQSDLGREGGRSEPVRAPQWRRVQLLPDAVPGADLRREPDRPVPVQRQRLRRSDAGQPVVQQSAGQRQRHLALLLGAPGQRQCARSRGLPVPELFIRLSRHAMKSLLVITLAAAATVAAAAGPLVGAAGPWPYPGLQAESPLKLVDII